MNKKIIISLILVAVVAVIGYNYLYQDHRDVATSDATASFESAELLELFTDDDVSNDVKALDQVIEIQGTVTNVADNTITIDGQIFVEMTNMNNISSGQVITVKGRCLGYDDLMEEVKIDQATKQ